MAWLYWLISVLAGLFALLVLAGGYMGYKKALVRSAEKKPLQTNPNPAEKMKQEKRDAGIAWFMAQQPEDISLQARDGLALKGYYLPAARPSNKLVVFSHGYTSTGPAEFGAFTRFYHEVMNYHILLPDQRSHGRSEGKYIGFAALEWQDIFDWAATYVERLGPDTQVVLHGVSMGAATVMNCNAHNPPAYIKCIVEDCGFTNGYEMVTLAAKRDLNLNIPPVFWGCALWYRLFTGKSLKRDADPYGNIEKFARPTLFIHGDNDLFVPTEMSVRCYNAAKVPKELLLIPQAGHAYAYYMGQEEYEAKLAAFCGRYMKETVEA